MPCEQCGDTPCTCAEQQAAYMALYGHEHCQACGGLLDEQDRCGRCDWLDGIGSDEDEDEDEA